MLITGLSGAKVVSWTAPTSNTTKSASGVGFSPDLVLHVGIIGMTAIPSSAAFSRVSLGAMNKHGQQWANAFSSEDNSNPSDTNRFQQTDACLVGVAGNADSRWEAHFVSMDTDGFTTTWSDNNGTAEQIISLCIKGISSRLGAFTKSGATAPATQVIERVGFTPKGIMTSGINRDPISAPTTSAAWWLGLSDGANSRSVALVDTDNVTPTQADSIWVEGKVSLGLGAGPSVPAEADLSSFDNDGFTLNWTTNNSSGHEILYMALGDPETDTFPATIGTSTATTATSYGNQRKLVRLSTGRMVAVFGDTSTNAKFKYSDDGVTWTDYQADIAGWANGSISSYVTSGGAEYIVAVWEQSGTGGGRTNGDAYIMTGSLNSSRTSISWGSALGAGSGSGSPGTEYPTLVAHAEGTGGAAHVVLSQTNATPTNTVIYSQFTVSSNGVISATNVNNTIGAATYGVNVATFPSIDYNPVTKDLFVAWSAGTTGSGKGIRFRKATYSSSSWTWNTEREIDSTHYLADNVNWLNCVFDGARVLIGGEFWNGSVLNIMLYERDAADTTTTPRILAANVGGSPRAVIGSLTYDREGNVYVLGIGGGTGAQPNYRIWNRSTQTTSSQYFLESWFSGQSISAARGYYNGKIDFIYTYGNNSPYAVKYDYIQVTGGDSDAAKQNRWGIIPI
jgi:hypothetical protein